MIARQWVGETLESDADTYASIWRKNWCRRNCSYQGNQGVWLMRRVREGRAEFMVISMWDSLESIKAFAGHEYRKSCLLSRRQEVPPEP